MTLALAGQTATYDPFAESSSSTAANAAAPAAAVAAGGTLSIRLPYVFDVAVTARSSVTGLSSEVHISVSLMPPPISRGSDSSSSTASSTARSKTSEAPAPAPWWSDAHQQQGGEEAASSETTGGGRTKETGVWPRAAGPQPAPEAGLSVGADAKPPAPRPPRRGREFGRRHEKGSFTEGVEVAGLVALSVMAIGGIGYALCRVFRNRQRSGSGFRLVGAADGGESARRPGTGGGGGLLQLPAAGSGSGLLLGGAQLTSDGKGQFVRLEEQQQQQQR